VRVPRSAAGEEAVDLVGLATDPHGRSRQGGGFQRIHLPRERAAALVVFAIGALWVNGNLDEQLAPVGLNTHDCVEIFGNYRCGSDLDDLRQRLRSASTDSQKSLEEKPDPPPIRAEVSEAITLAAGKSKLRVTVTKVNDLGPSDIESGSRDFGVHATEEALIVVEAGVAAHGVAGDSLTLGTDNGTAYTSRGFRARLAELGTSVALRPSGNGRARGLYCRFRDTGGESGDIRCTGSRGRVVRWQTAA